MKRESAVRVLVIEDDPGDVVLLKEALAVWSRPRALEHCADGESARARVASAGLPGGGDVPDLVILDLNLPRLTGREVFTALRANPALDGVPVVILTTSASDQDIVDRRDPRLNLYLTKPMRLDDFLGLAKVIESFCADSRRRSAAPRALRPR
jgi:CheY-like chemotaxis protein